MRKKSGFLLASALILLVIIAGIGSGMMILTAYDFFGTRNYLADDVIVNIADAGVENAIYRMENGNYSGFSANLTPSTPSGISSWGSYSVNITQLSSTSYLIESTGSLNGKSKKVSAVVETIAYNQYIVWNDVENGEYNNSPDYVGYGWLRGNGKFCYSPGYGDWVGNAYMYDDVIDGPAYINGEVWTYYGTLLSHTIFKKSVTLSPTSNTLDPRVHYHLDFVREGYPYPNSVDPGRVYEQAPVIGTSTKAWPFTSSDTRTQEAQASAFNTSFNDQRTVANGGNSVYDSTPSGGQYPVSGDVTLSNNGGVYARGNWAQVDFEVENGKQVIYFGNGYNYTGSSEQLNSDQTLVENKYIKLVVDGNSTTQYIGTTTGKSTSQNAALQYTQVRSIASKPKVIFVDGCINGMRGTVKENFSLFCNNYIRINGNIIEDVDNDLDSVGSLENSDGNLGLVSPYLWFPNTSASDTWWVDNYPYKVQASIIGTGTGGVPLGPDAGHRNYMATGSFFGEGALTCLQPDAAHFGPAYYQKYRKLQLTGAMAQKYRGLLGLYHGNNEIEGATGAANDLTPLCGFNLNYKYDTRLTNNSPAYFPNSGNFYVRYWVIN